MLTSTLIHRYSDTGTADYLSQADDGLPVPTPREIEIILTDAKQRQVGSLRYPVFNDTTQAALSAAIIQLESAYSKRSCSVPPPRID
jgi:hypothetical protein